MWFNFVETKVYSIINRNYLAQVVASCISIIQLTFVYQNHKENDRKALYVNNNNNNFFRVKKRKTWLFWFT